MATNLTLMQQFLTLFNKILAKWHLFIHSALREKMLKMSDLYGVFENIEVPDKAWDDEVYENC